MNTNKPLSEWTLGEIKQRCDSCCAIPEDCVGCPARRANGACAIGEPFECWDLSEPPRWTEQDKEDAKMIKRVFNGFQTGIVRDTLAQLRTIAKDGYPSEYINSDMFPSLKPGESATLDEIIGGGE